MKNKDGEQQRRKEDGKRKVERAKEETQSRGSSRREDKDTEQRTKMETNNY